MKKNKLNIFDEMDKIKSQIKDRVLSNQNLLKYIYYGNYEGLYQFVSKEKVILLPIDSGYIEYKK